MSAIVPPAFPKGDDPKKPARKRRIIRVWIFLAPAAPALKAVSRQNVAVKMCRRPNVSLSGAHLLNGEYTFQNEGVSLSYNRGPNAKPKTNREIPRIATSSPQSKSLTIWPIPPEYAEDTRATVRVTKDTKIV